MAKRYKFKESNDVVELDPKQGQLVTTANAAAVDYYFNSWTSSFDAPVGTIELSMDCQDFLVADLDDLISFLQAAKEKLVQQNNTLK